MSPWNCHPLRVGPISDSKTHQRHSDYINYNYKNSASPSCPTLQAAQSLFTLVHIILTTALRQVLSPPFKKKKKKAGEGGVSPENSLDRSWDDRGARICYNSAKGPLKCMYFNASAFLSHQKKKSSANLQLWFIIYMLRYLKGSISISLNLLQNPSKKKVD